MVEPLLFPTISSASQHRFHPLCWLGCLFILNLAVLAGGAVALGLISLFIGVLLYLNRLSPFMLLKSLRGLLLFVFLVWVILILGDPTLPGLAAGTLTASRFFLLLLLGALLTATISLTELQALLEKLLKPFPFLPAARLALLFTLTLRFLSLIGQKSQAAREAQWARSIQNRKNPLYHLTCYATVLFRNLFLQAEELSQALEARCYTETGEPAAKPTGHPPTVSSDSLRTTFAQLRLADFFLLGLVLIVSGSLILLKL